VKCKITGIQKAGERNPITFSTLRPTGAVTLVHDTENAYDPFAVKVLYETDDQIVDLGYLPGQKRDGKYVGSEIQKHVIESEITTAQIESYCYIDGDTFNEEHKGLLASVMLSFDADESAGGKVAGANYQRVTSFISYFDAYGGGDGLMKWAFKKASEAMKDSTHEEIVEKMVAKDGLFDVYKTELRKTSDAGTMMHAAIEAVLSGSETFECPGGLSVVPEPDHAQTGQYEASEWLPEGWEGFTKKYEIEPCYMEKRFFDNTLMVTGQPDLVAFVNGELAVVDWKSSKKPSKKHEIQTAIYAKNAQWDGKEPDAAYVVAFGAENKQRFSVRRIEKAKIESYYTGMKLLRQCMDACNVWISTYWDG